MSMQLFFQETITEPITYLSEEESKHLIRVLRKQKGDQLNLTDGKGTLYHGYILESHSKKASIQITGKIEAEKEDFHIHLAIAPTKSPDRMEWMVEKITEIGFHELTLLECKNSERTHLKTDRLEKKIIAACKQSLKLRIPELHPTIKFSSFLSSPELEGYHKFIAYVDENHTNHLLDLAKPGEKYLILIGPEGDFDPIEIKEALSFGFKSVSLGKSRLRTETAGMVAVQMLQVLNR